MGVGWDTHTADDCREIRKTGGNGARLETEESPQKEPER